MMEVKLGGDTREPVEDDLVRGHLYPSRMPELLGEVSHVAAVEHDLESLTRPLLDLAQKITQLQSTYLTRIKADEDIQQILFSRNLDDDFQIPEGLNVPWGDTVCKRALDRGIRCTDDVQNVFADSQAARELGIQTYVSVPVTTPDGHLFGTLCGASGAKVAVDEPAMEIMTLFARLIADQVAREDALRAESSRAHLAEERLRRRARFLAEANHMLKTPLAIITGWADLLYERRDELPPDRLASALALIKDKGYELKAQIDVLLDEARVEVLAADLHLQRLDVASVVRGAAEHFGTSDKHPVDYGGVDHAYALAAKEPLDQVLGHLVENAVKYSPEGGAINLRVENEASSVVISVCDEGVGLPDGVDPFEPFRRGAAETTKGIGLGLHIVRSLVEVMNGEVEARRNEERGSTFTIRLPAV